MTFVEFVSVDGSKRHFVGVSLNDVLADVGDDGSKFGFPKISSHREITEEEARALNLGYFEDGVRSVRRGCKSYLLGTPRR